MKDTGRANVVSAWFPEGYFYSFSHTATSLNYSELFSIPQHCPACDSPAMPQVCLLNKRMLQSKIQSSPRQIHFLLKLQTKGAAATCCSNRAKSREQKWVVACAQKTATLASQRLHMKETSPHAPACFFRLRNRREVIFSLCIRQKKILFKMKC